MPPGGWGGRSTKDGNSATWVMLGNCRDLPIEVMEALYPVRVACRELITDSAGPGKFRGGLAVKEAIVGLTKFNCMMRNARSKFGPPGIFGGMPGKPLLEKIIYPDGREIIYAGWKENNTWECGGKMFYDLPPGTMVVLENAGGGGYGDPLERDPNLVLEDVLDGYVSLKAAEEIYGIRINPETLKMEKIKGKKKL
jgi:N-methylhydantoinase B